MKLAHARHSFKEGDLLDSFNLYSELYYSNNSNFFDYDDWKNFYLLCVKLDRSNLQLEIAKNNLIKYGSPYWLLKYYRSLKRNNSINSESLSFLSNYIASYGNNDSMGNYYVSIVKFLLDYHIDSVLYNYKLALKNINYQHQKKPSKFNPENSLKSSLDLIDLINDKHLIKSFFIGGSLLGLVRNGKLLDHDKDVDLGIIFPSSFNSFKFVSSIVQSGRFIAPNFFSSPPNSRNYLISFWDKKYNSTIDIFLFHKNNKTLFQRAYLLAGCVQWNYENFSVKSINLLERSAYIPDQPENFLISNFGFDWMVEKDTWDSILLCPNISASNKTLIYHALKKLFESKIINNDRKANMYIDFLHGKGVFV